MIKTALKLNLNYSHMQETVFFNTDERFRVVAKGRRLGFTRGAAQYVIEMMLRQKVKNVLWGDTVLFNIRSYYERYFKPVLSSLPCELYSWRVTDKQLVIGDTACDFRSADNPENWEGFGYDLVILNEAGIILKNRYLWENAVRPMLLDNDSSIAIIGGTPKGKGLFYELWQKGNNNEKDWKSFRFSTYSNPFLSKDSVDDFVKDMGKDCELVRQEIYGEFLDVVSNCLFNHDLVESAVFIGAEPPNTGFLEVWGIDVARHGFDNTAVAKRRDDYIYCLKRFHIADLMSLADQISLEYSSACRKPDAIFIEVTGIGWGVYDRCVQLGLPVIPADVSLRSLEPKIFNKRSEMYKRFASFIERNGRIPADSRLKEELLATEYSVEEDGVFKLISKDRIRCELNRSPDSADACALTFFAHVEPARHEDDLVYLPTGAW